MADVVVVDELLANPMPLKMRVKAIMVIGLVMVRAKVDRYVLMREFDRSNCGAREGLLLKVFTPR